MILGSSQFQKLKILSHSLQKYLDSDTILVKKLFKFKSIQMNLFLKEHLWVSWDYLFDVISHLLFFTLSYYGFAEDTIKFFLFYVCKDY